jgi:hypothetical protein
MKPQTVLLATALAVLPALAGCVERKMVVRSDPPGALISVDGHELDSRTPVEVPFSWGGLRRVTLSAPGYRVLETTAELTDAWHAYFPLDVVAEFCWPLTIEDTQTFDYRLEPYQAVGSPLTDAQRAEAQKKLQELKLRAAEYRAGGSQGPGAVVVPPPPSAPPEPQEPAGPNGNGKPAEPQIRK